MKRTLTALLLIMSILAITACSEAPTEQGSTDTPPSEASEQEQASESDEMQKLVVWSRDTEDSVVGVAVKSDAEAFMVANPNIEVELLHIPHADVVTKWNTAFAGGTAPDVMDVGVSHIVGRVELDHLLPLDDYYNNWADKDNLASAMVDYGLYDDKIYALAYNAAPPVMAWRKDYFEGANLDPDAPPADWEQMVEYAEALVEKDGDIVTRGALELVSTRGAHFLTQFFMQNEVFEQTYTDGPNFTEDGMIEAATFLADLAPNAILSQTGSSAFEAGNAAISLSISPVILQSMIEADPSLEDKIGFAPSLTNLSGGIHAGAWLYSISTQSKIPDTAWSWIEFIFSEERSAVRMNEMGIVPPINSLNDDYIAMGGELYEAQFENLKQSQAYPKLSWTNIYEESMHVAYDEIVYGTKTPEQAMQDLEDDCKNKI